MEEILLNEIAENIGSENRSVEELIDNIMQRVEWTKADEKRWKKLTPEQRERLTQPTYLVRQIAEIRYTKESLKHAIYLNLKRAPGNLREEDRMLGLYDTLEKFEYKCPYSDTLLIGGEQPIHIDHIIPVTMGGPTDDWNCIPVCGSCNDSKNKKHLLDWWQDNRTVEEEYKLVRIFEHMTSKLLDNSNKIRYVETKDNTKHLDVITFLNQLLDHIEQNKQYILGPNTSILDDNTKAIDSKLKELKKTFEKVVKKNSDKTLKTDKQYFEEQKQMLKYVKRLGVRSYYKIAYTYFDEIQEMLNQGLDEEEIRQFCFDRDDSFNFTLFLEKLDEYKQEFGDCLVPITYVCNDGYRLGIMVSDVRHNDKKTNGVQKQILKDIEFVWHVRGYDIDNIRLEVKCFVNDFKNFIDKHNCFPKSRGKEDGENGLYSRWIKYTKRDNINQEEEVYLIKNGFEIKDVNRITIINNIRSTIIKFVEDYNNFINQFGRNPQNHDDIEEGESLYRKYVYYLSSKNSANINNDEIKYLKNNLIILKVVIRKEIVKFVNEFNAFINSNNRMPKQRSEDEMERSLYNRYKKYTNHDNLKNKEEIGYIAENLVQLEKDGIRKEIKQFVEDYNAFIRESKRHLNDKRDDKRERRLYSQWKRYTNPKNPANLNQIEIGYLESLGINIRNDNRGDLVIKKFVKDYLLFITTNNRKPSYHPHNESEQQNKDEKNLYARWYRWSLAKNLNPNEIHYLQEHGIEVRGLEEMQETETKLNGGLGL